MSDHINTTCCKRHAVELLNAFPDEDELANVDDLPWEGNMKGDGGCEDELDRLRSELARLREVANEGWVVEFNRVRAQRDTLLAALSRLSDARQIRDEYEAEAIARAAIAEAKGTDIGV